MHAKTKSIDSRTMFSFWQSLLLAVLALIITTPSVFAQSSRSSNLNVADTTRAQAPLSPYPGWTLWSGFTSNSTNLIDMDGIDLCRAIVDDSQTCGIPVIVMGKTDNSSVIQDAKAAGCQFFLSKPIDESRLLAAVEESLNVERQRLHDSVAAREARHRFSSLTPREFEVMKLVVAGRLNKLIAVDLDISEKTVKAHRAKVMHKTKSRSVAELVHLYIAAQGGSDPG